MVLVLRRHIPHAVRQLHQGRAGRRRACRDAYAGDLFGRHRRRFITLRTPVGAQGRTGLGALRLDRPVTVRHRPVLRQSRAGAAKPRRRRRVPWQTRALADHRRPDPDRHVRRLLHRPAVCAHPGAFGACVPLANHRRQQYSQCAVHGRIGRHGYRPAQCRTVDSAAVHGHRRDECSRRPLHLSAGAGIPDAFPGVAAHPHLLSGRPGRIAEHPGGGRLRDRLQSRELCRCGGDRRARSPPDTLRDGLQDLRHADHQLHLSYHARDSHRIGQGRCRDEGTCF